jgi:hypothetical protein
MCINHEVIINDYNRFVFTDPLAALECYKLLSMSKETVRMYEVNEDKTTDYSNWTDEERVPNIKMQVYRAKEG